MIIKFNVFCIAAKFSNVYLRIAVVYQIHFYYFSWKLNNHSDCHHAQRDETRINVVEVFFFFDFIICGCKSDQGGEVQAHQEANFVFVRLQHDGLRNEKILMCRLAAGSCTCSLFYKCLEKLFGNYP